MREIKFRGKRYDNGEWVYGSLHDYAPIGRSIYVNNLDSETTKGYLVQSYSVGQFTGLKDKNGTEIYEGDILKMPNWSYPVEVIYSMPKCRFCCRLKGDSNNDYIPLNSEVIGNIYENPELLTIKQ